MNIKQLEKELEIIGLDKTKYNLGDRSMRELELGLIQENGIWIVYQAFEKGGYNVVKTFDNEDEACDLMLYFLKLEKKEENILGQ